MDDDLQLDDARLDDDFHLDPDFPVPYASIDLALGDKHAALTIMSRGTRFHVHFTIKDLRDFHHILYEEELNSQTHESGDALVREYFNFRTHMDDHPQAMEAFEEWMLKPCLPYIDELAPEVEHREPPSLAEYFSPKTFTFKLVNSDGHLKAIRCPDDPAVSSYLAPKVPLSDPAVSEALSQDVDCIPASQIVAFLEPDAHIADYDLYPGTVRITGDDSKFHFKSASVEESFRRELNLLLKFRRDVPSDLRVSRLGGLVTWNDGAIMGLLVDYIDGSKTLDWAIEEGSISQRQKWARQIRDTVGSLHDVDITWGDVKPDNVLVDANGDAWVIDFGGGRCEGWVDQELEGTKEGDLQGLLNLDKFLGVGPDI